MKTHDKSHIKQQKLLDWLYYQLKNLGGGSGTTTAAVTYPVENAYPDQASMLADQVNQTINYFQYQIDTDTYYEYLGTTNAAIGDYRELTADETLIINGKTLAPISKIYADATAMYADQKKQLGGFIYRTLDDDVYFGYLGTRNGDATDYIPFGGSAPDLSGYVPYTGATATVNLGTNNFSANTASFTNINAVSGTVQVTGGTFRLNTATALQVSNNSSNSISNNQTNINPSEYKFKLISTNNAYAQKSIQFDYSGVTTNATSVLTVPDKNGIIALIGTTAPANATDTGVVGEIRVTSTFIYTCIATNTWVRAAVATW